MATKHDDKIFLHGFAVAVGSLAREHGQPSMAKDIMISNGYTLKDFKKAGVEAFDTAPLEEEWKVYKVPGVSPKDSSEKKEEV